MDTTKEVATNARELHVWPVGAACLARGSDGWPVRRLDRLEALQILWMTKPVLR